MKLVTAVLRPHAVDDVIERLQGVGISGGTTTEVQGFGQQKGRSESYRGATYEALVPKTRLEVLLPAEEVEAAVGVITATASTGKVGDGKVWVTDVSDVVRVRTGDRGAAAL
ncbi:P-II family nitrogen regulator [Nocardioides ferulae]|uniref:P-II family nitrogen regulator n=1 Tax=Nocardioides ferulae TaxID=2340821 RepID=UPI000EB3076D|nr:P-II family nitrogen regulator [Nocardioides ferulae]